jgi:nucleotide-binding universal stress UspA family protein
MPSLVLSDQVYIVMVERGGLKSDEIPGADIGQHLRRHGVHCKIERIVDLEVDAADVILSHASDVGADLIIMGGYGHSRLREFVLGGVTRDILKTMTVPTMMSH